MSEEIKNAGNTRGRPFPKGNAGRPRGARNRSTLAAERLLDGQLEALTDVCIQKALAGDMLAMRLCLERALPVRKGARVRLRFPPMETAGDIVKGLGVVLAELGGGALTPDEAAVISGILATKAESIRTSELEERIRRLEGSRGNVTRQAA